MRTNIDIDDALLAKAMAFTGLKTKKAVVEEGLRTLARFADQVEAIEGMRGLGWEGDLDEMRRGWSADVEDEEDQRPADAAE